MTEERLSSEGPGYGSRARTPRRRRGPITGALLVPVLLACVAPATAQDFPTWFVRAEVGGAEVEQGGFQLLESDLDDLWGGLRIGRAFGRSGSVALDVGLEGSSAACSSSFCSGDGFMAVTGGLELRAFARKRVSPYVRLETGYELLGNCLVAGLGAGVRVRIERTTAWRAGVTSSNHCQDGIGPAVAYVGMEFRW